MHFPIKNNWKWILLGLAVLPAPATGAEDWEPILKQALASELSQTRHEGLKQVDASTSKGLRAIWAALSLRDPNRIDWYVREGAYEALMNAQGEEAEKEIDRVLKGSGNDLAKEAIIYSIIWKIRKEVIKAYGENNDRKIEEVKYQLRKKRGVEYFEYVLPVVAKFDPEKRYLKRVHLGLQDKLPRVRRAAITGLTTYPDNSNILPLLENLKKLEKQKAKNYREWVLTRFALETLTGQYHRDDVSKWLAWWDTVKDKFSLEKRVEEEKGKEEPAKGKTVVMKKEEVEVTVHMKVVGPPDGYPLLVIPWRGFEVDYFRPYFHGVEEFCRVFYVRMPQIDDYKGLPRHAESNLVQYPTKILAKALTNLMKDSGLEKFGLLAHGPDAGTLAMMLIADHPGRVTHLVLINPQSSGDAYSNCMENVRREGLRLGNKEIVKGIDSISLMQDGNPKYKPADGAESASLSRALQNLHFPDPTEPEVGAFGYLHDLPGGTQCLNDSSWSARTLLGAKPLNFPVMIFMGEKDPWTPVSDMMIVAGVFKNALLVKLPNASETPFISDTYEFTERMKAFFRGAKAPKPAADETGASEKKPERKTKTKTKVEPKAEPKGKAQS